MKDNFEGIAGHHILSQKYRDAFDAMSMPERHALPLNVFLEIMRLYVPQSYGAQIESRIINDKNWTKVGSSLERGDAKTIDNEYIEIKVSMLRPSKGSKVNFVQIRPHHKLDSYACYVVDVDNVFHEFYLTKAQMANEIIATNAALAHGSKKTNNNVNKEYAIRFSWKQGDDTYDRWVQNYKVASKNVVPTMIE